MVSHHASTSRRAAPAGSMSKTAVARRPLVYQGSCRLGPANSSLSTCSAMPRRSPAAAGAPGAASIAATRASAGATPPAPADHRLGQVLMGWTGRGSGRIRGARVGGTVGREEAAAHGGDRVLGDRLRRPAPRPGHDADRPVVLEEHDLVGANPKPPAGV